MSRLHVIALGGTIAATNSGSDASAGVSPSVSAREIAAAAGLDTLPGGAPEVTFDQVAQVGSGSITLGMLDAVVASARQARAEGARGVVLTQGTDTLGTPRSSSPSPTTPACRSSPPARCATQPCPAPTARPTSAPQR